MKHYFSNIASKKINSKNFWKPIKLFLTNKGCLENSDIILRDSKKIITVEKKLVQLFHDHYINIIERSSVMKPEKLELILDQETEFYVLF